MFSHDTNHRLMLFSHDTKQRLMLFSHDTRNSPSTEISLVSLEKMKTLSSTTQGEKEDKFTPAAKNPHVWHDDHFGGI